MNIQKERLESLLETSLEMQLNLNATIAKGELNPKQIEKAIHLHHEYTHAIIAYVGNSDADKLNTKIYDLIVRFNAIVLNWNQD